MGYIRWDIFNRNEHSLLSHGLFPSILAGRNGLVAVGWLGPELCGLPEQEVRSHQQGGSGGTKGPLETGGEIAD